jgi:hypothetical protein
MVRGLSFCLAAVALAGAMVPPLLVPPRDMQSAPILPIIQEQLASHGAEMLALYRDPAHPNYAIQLERFPARGMNADERGVRAIAGMLNSPPGTPQPARTSPPCSAQGTQCSRIYSVRFSGGTYVTSHAVTLCGDRAGWLNKVIMGSGSSAMAMTQVFARSGDDMYEAEVNSPATGIDTTRAEASLLTLCPPLPAETPQPQVSAGVEAPGGWIAAAIPQTASASGVRMSGEWIRLGPATNTLEALMVVERTDTSGAHTLEEASAILSGAARLENARILTDASSTLCEGQQGWSTSVAGTFNGRQYVVESTAGFADSIWYVASYSRRAEDPDDARARAAIASLCPKV